MKEFNEARLRQALNRYIDGTGKALREIEAEAGVSASTLSRFRNETGSINLLTTVRLCEYLQLPVSRFLDKENEGQLTVHVNESLPDTVEALVLKDESLNPLQSDVLINCFRSLYGVLTDENEKETAKRAGAMG